MHKPATRLRWGKRIEFPGVMDLIGVEEVKALFDGFDATRPGEADQTAR